MSGNALATLGLALKAQRLACGTFAVRKSANRARGLLLANDAGVAAVREAKRLSEKHGLTPETVPFGKDALGRALGQGNPCSIVAVLDEGLLNALKRGLSHGCAD
ncbi:MAG: hypothetical protein LBI44_03660 [Oscillospiraceae bacterium]|jgi:ribosomal protein L7Ae-like RNA K-turn-binding protein|nr:hypothetical protein [Oscillospiraceae bacterium]